MKENFLILNIITFILGLYFTEIIIGIDIPRVLQLLKPTAVLILLYLISKEVELLIKKF